MNYGPEGVLTIKGRPVVPVEYAETVGTVGDISLVDMSKYRLIRKGGVEQASSMHVYFAAGEQAPTTGKLLRRRMSRLEEFVVRGGGK